MVRFQPTFFKALFPWVLSKLLNPWYPETPHVFGRIFGGFSITWLLDMGRLVGGAVGLCPLLLACHQQDRGGVGGAQCSSFPPDASLCIDCTITLAWPWHFNLFPHLGNIIHTRIVIWHMDGKERQDRCKLKKKHWRLRKRHNKINSLLVFVFLCYRLFI